MIPKDIGNVLGLYYGNTIGNTFERLFYNQLNLTIQVIDAYIQKEPDALSEDTIRLLDENTYLIANLFSQINPNLNQRELEDLFCCQLELTREELLKRINKDYMGDVNLYDFIEYHALMFADIITEGLTKQFYEKS